MLTKTITQASACVIALTYLHEKSVGTLYEGGTAILSRVAVWWAISETMFRTYFSR